MLDKISGQNEIYISSIGCNIISGEELPLTLILDSELSIEGLKKKDLLSLVPRVQKFIEVEVEPEKHGFYVPQPNVSTEHSRAGKEEKVSIRVQEAVFKYEDSEFESFTFEDVFRYTTTHTTEDTSIEVYMSLPIATPKYQEFSKDIRELFLEFHMKYLGMPGFIEHESVINILSDLENKILEQINLENQVRYPNKPQLNLVRNNSSIKTIKTKTTPNRKLQLVNSNYLK